MNIVFRVKVQNSLCIIEKSFMSRHWTRAAYFFRDKKIFNTGNRKYDFKFYGFLNHSKKLKYGRGLEKENTEIENIFKIFRLKITLLYSIPSLCLYYWLWI